MVFKSASLNKNNFRQSLALQNFKEIIDLRQLLIIILRYIKIQNIWLII